MEQSAAIIAPLQIARGVQNKVLEAMSCRKAVVVSNGAAEGIHAEDGRHMLVAQTPGQWVDHISRVFNDSPYRVALGREARQRVEQSYSWEEQLAPMVKLIRGE